MQLLKRVKWIYVVLSLFLIAMGVCLFMWPEIPSVTICCAIGGGAVLFGIIKIVFYFLREIERVGEQYDFAIGSMCVIAGAILLIHPADVLSMIPQVLGVCMLMDSVFKLQIALDAKRLGNKGWWVSLLITLVCIVWGIVLILRDLGPFGLDKYLTILIGGGLVADGVQNLVAVVYMAGTVKKTEAVGKEITEPAEPMIPVTSPVKEPALSVAPVKTEPVKIPESAPAPAKKKRFSLFDKKKETPAPDAPAQTEPVQAPEAEEDDGSVAEIKFEMTEGDHGK